MATQIRPRALEIAEPLVLRMHPAVEMSDDQLLEFCLLNKELRIERTAEGDMEIMPPTGWVTSNRNAILTHLIMAWALQDGTGMVSDSNGGFILPNGAMRAPDAAWARRERLAERTAEQKQNFLPLCPDFVIELISPSDHLATVQAKLREYIENGARLGWLLDPDPRRVYVYRPNEPVQVFENPDKLSGEPVLPGLVLELRKIWRTSF